MSEIPTGHSLILPIYTTEWYMSGKRNLDNSERIGPTPILTARRFGVSELPQALSAQEIATLRRRVLGVSQRLFADLLSVAPQTVHSWEQGDRKPSGMALRLLNLAAQHPGSFKSLLRRRMNNNGHRQGDHR